MVPITACRESRSTADTRRLSEGAAQMMTRRRNDGHQYASAENFFATIALTERCARVGVEDVTVLEMATHVLYRRRRRGITTRDRRNKTKTRPRSLC